jgi:hypothetical protein
VSRGRRPTTGRFDTRAELCGWVWSQYQNTPANISDIARQCRVSAAVVAKILDAGEGRPDPQATIFEEENHMKQVGNIIVGGQTHQLHEARYDNRRVAIVINEGRFGKLTVNLPDNPLAPGLIFVKTWGENEQLRQPALATGLFEDTGERVAVGFTQAEVWRYKGADQRADGRMGG